MISNYQCEDEDAKKVGNKPQVLIIDHRFIGTESVGKDEISRLQGPEAICRTEPYVFFPTPCSLHFFNRSEGCRPIEPSPGSLSLSVWYACKIFLAFYSKLDGILDLRKCNCFLKYHHLMLQHSGLFCLKSLSHKHIICLGDW